MQIRDEELTELETLMKSSCPITVRGGVETSYGKCSTFLWSNHAQSFLRGRVFGCTAKCLFETLCTVVHNHMHTRLMLECLIVRIFSSDETHTLSFSLLDLHSPSLFLSLMLLPMLILCGRYPASSVHLAGQDRFFFSVLGLCLCHSVCSQVCCSLSAVEHEEFESSHTLVDFSFSLVHSGR